eukprot:COSAG06_NODE_8268_length_2220_cov_2.934936_2_plen_104_part_01
MVDIVFRKGQFLLRKQKTKQDRAFSHHDRRRTARDDATGRRRADEISEKKGATTLSAPQHRRQRLLAAVALVQSDRAGEGPRRSRGRERDVKRVLAGVERDRLH